MSDIKTDLNQIFLNNIVKILKINVYFLTIH